MHCEAVEAEGTARPTVAWRRRDGLPLQKARVRALGGNITIDTLRRQDFGIYQCVAANEVATITADTQLVIEGTQPHAPYNVTGTATEFQVTLRWQPGYAGGPDYKQDYTIWHREAGFSEWTKVPVTPSGATTVTINRLQPGTTYEFQVNSKNTIGEGMMSKAITIRTLDVGAKPKPAPTPAGPPDEKVFPTAPEATGPKSGPPRNLTVTEVHNGFLITWQAPLERASLVQYYTIKYRTDAHWKTLNRGQIRPEETSYLVKNLVGGRTYYFRVLANSASSFESSEEVKFPVPARVKHKAITAGVVGGILFFIVAIILSVCAVKICNKRKRRKQEKAYNMVAARLTDLRAHHSTQVPFKKFSERGISSLVQCLRLTANWVWPASRCGRGSRGYWAPSLGSLPPPSPSPSAAASPSPSPAPSSSDDGGFLPRLRAPLQPAAAPPLFRASSPAPWPPWPPWPPWAAAWTPWSPLHISDLSSVPFPSSGEGSFPTPPSPFRPRLRPAGLTGVATVGAGWRPGPAARRHRPRAPAEPPPPPPHEASPESRSSSSGFGSKNASSSAHNRSSRAGSVAEWRPPPYRPPPLPPAPAPRPGSAADAGSVDVHYEWDRATRTPTPSTPERRPRARDDVEARVRAMKEEFLEFRKRQALRRRSPEPPVSPLAVYPLSPLSPVAPLAAAPAESVC
ncbi:protein turtle isoform X1 [Cydia strobilella]|uniref:protein turtle isoform X1 n=1 Tax=Cydia strobilella TaxID=1100964 RepID=UPI0030058E2C